MMRANILDAVLAPAAMWPTNISAPPTVAEIMAMAEVMGNTGLDAVVEVFGPAVV